MSYGLLLQTVEKLKAIGPIYMPVDTFMFLVLDRKVIDPSDVAGVFAWPGNQAVLHQPIIDPKSDEICRRVAYYYWHMHYHPVTDWEGNTRTFEHRAANTLSYRAYAPYQTVKREIRGRIAPAHPDSAAILQFDWAAAEWLLILQNLGYEPPQGDPYAQDIFGVSREEAKKIVLPRVYGASVEGIAGRHEGVEEDKVRKVIEALESNYPKVCEWVDTLTNNPNHRYADFHGFNLDLGGDPRKRPNRWAQTSLQICKWDLISRLTGIEGMHRTQTSKVGRMTVERPWSPASGDIHDRLVFDIYRGEENIAQQIINEIKAPCFGGIRLTPKITTGRTWE